VEEKSWNSKGQEFIRTWNYCFERSEEIPRLLSDHLFLQFLNIVLSNEHCILVEVDLQYFTKQTVSCCFMFFQLELQFEDRILQFNVAPVHATIIMQFQEQPR